MNGKSFLGALIGLLVACAGARADGWGEGSPLGAPRAFAASAVIGEEIYVIGGGGLSEPVSSVDVYDTVGDIWRSLPALPSGMEQAAAASVDGILYVSGGLGIDVSDGPLKAFWIFDPTLGVWNKGAEMPQGRYGHGMIAYGRKLYVLGGTGGSQILIYDIETATWSVRGSIPDSRKGASISGLGGKAYIIGGLDTGNHVSRRVDVLSFETGDWSRGADLPEARAGASLAALDGRLYLSGGQSLNPNKTYDDMFIYDPSGNTWRRGAGMTTPRHSSVSAGVGGRVYVIGGGTGAGVFTLFTGSDIVEIYVP